MKCLQGGQLSQLPLVLMNLAISSLKIENSRIIQDLFDPSIGSIKSIQSSIFEVPANTSKIVTWKNPNFHQLNGMKFCKKKSVITV